MPYLRFPPSPLFFLTYYLCISSSLSFFPWGKPLNKTFPRLSFASTVLLKSSSSIALTASRSPYGLTSAFVLCPLTLIHRKRKQKLKRMPCQGAWLKIHRISSVSSAICGLDMQSAKQNIHYCLTVSWRQFQLFWHFNGWRSPLGWLMRLDLKTP